MTLLRFPRHFFAAFMLLAILGLANGCGGKDDQAAPVANTAFITGKVTFTRIPVLTNANGLPIGLETDSTKFVTQPASGVAVRFLRATEETLPNGTKVTVWNPISALNQSTNSEGSFIANITKGDKVFIEILSRFQPIGNSVRILADPAGMYSGTPQSERSLYSLRKGLDGNSATNLPATIASSDSTVNFEVGLNDKWWITQENISALDSATLEGTGTGSRVLAIGHSVMKFNTNYGVPTPGAPLDLHYHRGRSESNGTFIEYNRNLTPLSFDSVTNTRHFFGSIRGGFSNDDAFDESLLLTIFARNFLVAVGTTNFLPLAAPMTHLSPDLALVEGLAPAMAATILKSPYLADTTSTTTNFTDIRSISSLGLSDKTPFSAPLISALAWEIGLKSASITPPGLPTDWAKLDTLTLQRFFIPRVAADTSGLPSDLVSLYSQIARLKESKASGETVDLAAIFTDAALTPFLAPFNITWPRPTAGPLSSFLSDFGKDPNTLLAPVASFQYSMSNAVEIAGMFPNVTETETYYARFTLSKDTAFNLSASMTPPLPSGTSLEILVDGTQSLLFSSESLPHRITLRGNSTSPTLHTLRMRLISPHHRIADTRATIHLELAP